MIRNKNTKGNKTMKLSEAAVRSYNSVPLSSLRIETNTDGYAVISNNSQLQSYLNTFGDVEVEWDSADKVYRVPAFRLEIEKYNAAKAAQCKIWGCE
jgi:hypothetical protein